MSTIFYWLFWIAISIFGGCVINRILFWTGEFIWKWSKRIMFQGKIWFDKGTTIKDICDNIKYEDGYDHDGYYNHENYYTDLYSSVNGIKWIPILNIAFAMAIFCIDIIETIFALLVGIIRLLIIFYVYILWPYFLKWICEGIVKAVMALYCVLNKLRIVNFYFYLKKVYQKTIYNLLHLRIA